MNKSTNRTLLVLAIIVLNVGLDQITKYLALQKLQGAPEHSYLKDTFRLLFIENDGAFLSLGSDLNGIWQLLLLKVLPIAMLLILLGYTLLSRSMNRGQVIAMSFILGGGISNIYDRVLYGKVVDFMNMGIGSLRTGIFNVADVSIMIGIGIFLVANFNAKKETPKEEIAVEES